MNAPIDLKTWIGRNESVDDVATAAALAGLAALLDHTTPPWVENELPPLGHWLYFLPRARQSQMDSDGHPHRGGFLPPVPLPRRMWAGSRVSFELPIPVGASLQRRSTITDVTSKSGRSGSMVFVTVRHEIILGDQCAIREEQDIVYREMPAPAADDQAAPRNNPVAAPASSQWTREFTAGPIELFRFSALTFNAHRIHYDRQYSRETEGYPGLVVHGPFVATLLMDHFLRHMPKVRIISFSFRAQRPLFDSAAFSLCLDGRERKADLWAVDNTGHTNMTATVQYETRA
jgi:3-methylfumaryl-CoA hydratase